MPVRLLTLHRITPLFKPHQLHESARPSHLTQLPLLRLLLLSSLERQLRRCNTDGPANSAVHHLTEGW